MSSRMMARTRRDVAALVAFLAIIFFAAHSWNAWDVLNSTVASHDFFKRWHLDDLIVAALFVPIAGLLFLLSRFWDLRRLLREREDLIQVLQTAREEVKGTRSMIHSQALTDRLTGLSNRARLTECIERLLHSAERGQGAHAILYMDFDNFKRVNDTYGHHVGDAFLREVACRLDGALNRGDTALARIGGDEFVALLTNLAARESAVAAAESVVKALSAPLDVDGRVVPARASIGVLFIDETYLTGGEILRDAEMAMYEAKRTMRGNYTVFDAKVRERWLRAARLEADLTQAIARQELHVAYQPIVSLVTGEVYGVEALLRWKHGELGPISPGEFIPIAEESDLIFEIGAWVFREACWQMATWIARFGDRAPSIVSINVSRKQFAEENLCERLAGIMRETGLAPQHVQVEVTEDMYAGDIQGAIRCMQSMKKLGLRIAIDDFGVGASTFAAVSQFPVDVLKVDRSLVENSGNSEESAAILHSLAILVHNLGAKLVAEGIEEPRQVTSLQELGCQLGQGYLFGKPMPADAIEAMFTVSSGNELTTCGAGLWQLKWSERLRSFDAPGTENRSTMAARNRAEPEIEKPAVDWASP